MWINKNTKLILSNLYYYDFVACNYNLLKSIGWDLTKIEFDNKLNRNIQIGLLQKNNPALARWLLEETNRLIDFYIQENSIKEEEIILRQRDGIIITRKLKENNITMPLELREVISKFILTLDRKGYLIIYSNGKVEVKGLPNKPVDTSFFDLFKNLDYSSKTNLIRGLENIRNIILESKNILWFTKENDNKYYIPIKNEGVIEINKSAISMIDPIEIEKELTWGNFIWPFARSILIFCHS